MPRANRYFLPGYIWHLTHRCHNKSYLLEYARDRHEYRKWLWKAKQRYGITILNYAITSNHIHLIVQSNDDDMVIPRSMQFAAGRTAQEYNRRTNRHGAFWEDRYHATAIENDRHLIECMVYVDLNMVRAGQVDDPADWPFCGLNDMRQNKKRCRIVDEQALSYVLNMKTLPEIYELRQELAARKIDKALNTRDDRWSKSIGVGSEQFLHNLKNKLGNRAVNKQISASTGASEGYELRESGQEYNALKQGVSIDYTAENTFFWNLTD